MRVRMLFAHGIGLFACLGSPCFARPEMPENLEAEILLMDQKLFERGFNECDFSALETAVSDDLEFYHDLGGMQDRAAFMDAMHQNICGAVTPKPIRKLVPDTNRIYPLYEGERLYGAIQAGDHNFYLRDAEGTETLTGSAAFVALWLVEDGQWRLRRALSFDHSGADALPPGFAAGYRSPLFDNDAHIEAMLGMMDIPTLGMARIVDGQLQQVRVFGDLDDGSAAPLDTLYKVASLTKPIVTMLTLRLADAGLWNLETPLADDYVDPELAGDPLLARLTSRTVLSHRSGLPNWRYLREDGRLLFEFPPGERQQYSGEGFEYLRRALEARFGEPIEELARQWVFEPAGMIDTHFYWDSSMRDQLYAAPHDSQGQPIAEKKHYEANAAANLLTTTSDYGRFIAWVIQGAGLSDGLRAAMVEPNAGTDTMIPFGLGWQVIRGVDTGNGFALQHTGGDAGIKCIALMLPASGDGLVLLTNSENGMRIWAKAITEAFPEAGSVIVARNLSR